MLLLLDDAASHEQVTPLLPGTAGSVVLITSRRHLTALEDAAAISLDTLAPGEAAALLARLAGRPDLGSGDGAAAEITRLCGYLPLAIGMLARQLHHHPAWTAAGLAAELAAAAGRLELMRAENLSVAAAFDLSYQDLTAGQQRLFRRLGVHPGTDIDAYAAAALDGTDLAAARRHLDGLYDHYLLAEPARGRYRLHDLLGEHARALAFAGDPADADAAAGRLLDYYLHTAAAAGQHIETRNTAAGRPLPGDRPAVAPPLSTAGQASAWLDAERANLHAAAGYAAASGRPGHAIAIPAAISGFLFARGHWDQSAGLHQAALAAARQAGDRAGQAGALNELGLLQRVTGDYPAAAASHQQALELYRGLGDRLGQASALDQSGPGAVRDRRLPGRRRQPPAGPRAVPRPRSPGRPGPGHRQSGRRAIVDRGLPGRRRQPPAGAGPVPRPRPPAGPGHAPSAIWASCNRWTGDYPAATASYQQALDLFRDLGDRQGQAHGLPQSGRGATADRGLPGRRRQLPAGAGPVPRPWSPAGPGRCHQQSGHCAIADRGLPGRRRQLDRGAGHVPRPRPPGHPAAAASLSQALGMFRDLGDRDGQAEVLNYLGEVLARSADSHQAHEHYARALAIAREISAPLEEARALEGLGHCLLRDGDPGDAAAHWQQALTIYQRIGAPDARRIQETLRQHGITTAPPPPSGQSRQPGAPTAP